MVDLPDVAFWFQRPELVRSTSVSRIGNRRVSFVEYADPFWEIPMRTEALETAEEFAVSAFLEEASSGMKTVVWGACSGYLPQAYFGNPDAPALANNGNLVSVTNGFQITVDSVTNGLDIRRGDLISTFYDGYRSLHRATVGAVAAAGVIDLTVEPAVPPYIGATAVVRFKDLELNTRMDPGSAAMTDAELPVATFTLVEVPK